MVLAQACLWSHQALEIGQGRVSSLRLVRYPLVLSMRACWERKAGDTMFLVAKRPQKGGSFKSFMPRVMISKNRQRGVWLHGSGGYRKRKGGRYANVNQRARGRRTKSQETRVKPLCARLRRCRLRKKFSLATTGDKDRQVHPPRICPMANVERDKWWEWDQTRKRCRATMAASISSCPRKHRHRSLFCALKHTLRYNW